MAPGIGDGICMLLRTHKQDRLTSRLCLVGEQAMFSDP